MMLRVVKMFSIAALLVGSFYSSAALAGAELYDAEKLREHFGLTAYSTDKISNVSIAILDIGFDGYEPNSPTLPASAELVASFPDGNPLARVRHGLSMAEIVWGMTGKNPAGPKLYLLNANGFTNFKQAVQFAIDKKVDIILYSQNWELGGNFDGLGFINTIVNQATEAGILWINAAGNYGGLVYNQKIDFESDQSVRFKNNYDENQVTLTLAWNDFTNSENDQATKDLDIAIYNSDGTQVAIGNKAQVPNEDKKRKPSQYAFEQIITKLPRGEYKVVIKKMGGGFDADQDRLRVTFKSSQTEQALELIDKGDTSLGEIMTPADNKNVITVGDLSKDSSRGPTADGRKKPDLVLDRSEARFTNGLITQGTSNAAAFFASIIAIMQAHFIQNNLPRITQQKIISWVHYENADLKPIHLSQIPKKVREMIAQHSGTTEENMEAARISGDRRVLLLSLHPSEIQTLYGDVVADAARRGLKVTDYDYYAGPEAFYDAGLGRWLITGFAPKGTPVRGLPASWVRVQQKGQGDGVWRTPAP